MGSKLSLIRSYIPPDRTHGRKWAEPALCAGFGDLTPAEDGFKFGQAGKVGLEYRSDRISSCFNESIDRVNNSCLSFRTDSRIAGGECSHPRLKMGTANFSNLQQAAFTTALIERKDQCGAVRVVDVGISV